MSPHCHVRKLEPLQILLVGTVLTSCGALLSITPQPLSLSFIPSRGEGKRGVAHTGGEGKRPSKKGAWTLVTDIK